LAAKKFLASREGAAEGGFKGGIPPRPSVPLERSGGGQFRSKKVRAKCIITAPELTFSELIAPLAVRAADGSLRKAKSAFVFAVKSQSSLN
jgi:hypothetical protein